MNPNILFIVYCLIALPIFFLTKLSVYNFGVFVGYSLIPAVLVVVYNFKKNIKSLRIAASIIAILWILITVFGTLGNLTIIKPMLAQSTTNKLGLIDDIGVFNKDTPHNSTVPEPPQRNPITIGDQAPTFNLPTTAGRVIGLSDLRGKVVLIYFWATWSPPCVAEIQTLDRLYRSLMGKDFEILAISVDEGGAPAVSSFLQKNGLSLPVLLDSGASVAHRYGTFKFPETYIVDRQGIVRHKVIGSHDWIHPAAFEYLRNLIAVR